MTKTSDSQTALLEHLRTRIREGWDHDPLFIDPSVQPGLTPRQKSSLIRASVQAATSDIPHFIAIVPGLSNSEAAQDGWGRFTADFAYSMFESAKAEQVIVIFSESEYSASMFAYIADDGGPRIPRGSDQLQRSKTNRFLPVELAVPYHLNLLIATVKGTEPPPLPDFDPKADEDDYIQANGLDYGDPDGFVFKATAAAAIGLTAWVLLRRNRYTWRGRLTRSPELVRHRRLPQALEAALRELPVPAAPGEKMWTLHDRGRRVQKAITEIVETHPDWATDIDFSHRHAIFALTETDRWLRRRLQRTTSARENRSQDEEPRFCFFFPTHTGTIDTFAWKQGKAVLTINVCADCRADFNAGHDPECLMVPKTPGAKRAKAVPYYQRDDAYAVSGFGSFADLEDAIVTKTGSGRV